jgi:hypothetical protein
MSERVLQIVCKVKGHDWRYFNERDKTIKFTGYLERCERCGEFRQIPQ